MPKFKVELTLKSYATVTIEAEDEEEVENMDFDRYADKNIWDFSEVEIDRIYEKSEEV